MKTYVDWFNELPEPYKTQALENVRGYMNSRADENRLYSSMSNAITSTMHWSETTQGHDYWQEIYDRYYRDDIKKENEEREKMEEDRVAKIREHNRIREDRLVTFSDSTRKMLTELKEYSMVANLMLKYSDKNLFCDYVTMRGDMCSYLPKGKPHIVTENNRWSREGRQEIKPGKLARKILHENDELRNQDYSLCTVVLTDKDFEQFSNMVKSYIGINGDEDGEGRALVTEVVSGEDIRKAYLEDNYSSLADKSSNLWGSCMRYDKCQDYFDIYVENNIKMLITKDMFGKIMGRALLWECENGRKAMDTIYAPENIRQVFIKWAIDNDYYYKSQQSCHHYEFDMYAGCRCNEWTATVKLSDTDYSEYPYMDTLYYLNNDRRYLSNRDDDWTHTLRSTDGEFDSRRNTVYDDWNGEDIDEDDAVYLDYHTDSARFNGYTHIDNTIDVEDGFRVISEHAIIVDELWYVIGSELIIYIDSRGEYCRLCDTVETYDGDIIHEDDAKECDHTGNTYHRDDMTEVEVYVFVHKDSVEDYLLEQSKEEENV